MNILSLLGFCSGGTNIAGLLVVNLYIYIIIQRQFRAGHYKFQPGSKPSTLAAIQFDIKRF
jgi:hypothetical protein